MPFAWIGLVPYQNHIKSIYGPYMGQGPPRCFNWACAISNPYQIHIWAIYGSPLFPKLDFGLGARVFSAVLLPLEPTINFSHSPAVSHSKTRDFRFPWARDPFFTPGQRFPILKHVTSGCNEPTIPHWSAGCHRKWFMTSPEVPSVTWSLSTNQKPGNLLSGHPLLLPTNSCMALYCIHFT